MGARATTRPGTGIYAPALLKELTEAAGDDLDRHLRRRPAPDVGRPALPLQPARSAHLTSAGLGTMGYGIPAGIGALLADPDATVVTVTGDGSIMMNIHELATLRRYRLPLKILLLDNSQLGMVRQWQELFFEREFLARSTSPTIPISPSVARAFGIEAFTIDQRVAMCRARSSGC